MKVDYPEELRHLISQLKRLPGIGPRSAERMALWLLRSPQSPSVDLAQALTAASTGVFLCPSCGFFASHTAGCGLCDNPERDPALVCVIEQATDILPLERTGAFKGQYHALHGRLSPLDNIGPDDLRIPALLQRLRPGNVREVILATGSDVEGEATANYLVHTIGQAFPSVTVSRLAQGLPAGGGLDSADDLTLYRALSGRRTLSGRGS
jgi:recombination protein RecR